MVLSVDQFEPKTGAALHSDTAAPPLRRIFLSWRTSDQNPTHSPSGDKNGFDRSTSGPRMSWASAVSIERRYNPAVVLYANRLPSADNAIACRPWFWKSRPSGNSYSKRCTGAGLGGGAGFRLHAAKAAIIPVTSAAIHARFDLAGAVPASAAGRVETLLGSAKTSVNS